MGLVAPYTEEIPEIHGVILIDCWESPEWKIHLSRYYQDLVQRLAPLELQCVVNACYGNQIDLNGTDSDTSMINTMNLYCWHDQSRHHIDMIYNMIRSCNGRNETSHTIRKYLLDRETSIFLTTIQDLETHWQKHLGARPMNWLVAGQTWQVCTHTRPLGFPALAGLAQRHLELQFFTADWSILKLDGSPAVWRDYSEDKMAWQEIRSWGFRLLPTITQ